MTSVRRRPATGFTGGLLIGLSMALFSSGCLESQGSEGRAERDRLLNTSLFLYSDGGHCLHSRKQATNLGVLRCVPAPRTLCRDDGLQEAGGNLIVTKATADRAKAELGALTTDAPACSDEVAITLALPTFKSTAVSKYDSIHAANVLEAVADCSFLGTAQSAKLVTRSAYGFLTSARGTVARQAKVTGDTTCIVQLQLAPEERALVDDVHAGNFVLETSCFYGSVSLGLPYSTNRCSQRELDAASAFDFPAK